MGTSSSIGARRILSLSLLAAMLAMACDAGAITITYVNSGPSDSRVFVGFANNASGDTTSDLVADPAAYSRNDTLYGPSTLPFDAMAYGGAELGTNLNAPLGAGVRSVFAPFNPTFFRAHGVTSAASGSYSCDAFAFSGNTTSTTPTAWIVHVDPSGAEVAGTPADVTVTGSIAGDLSVAGVSVADASWNVAATSFGTVMSGTANQSVAGSSSFSDSGSLTFTVPLGGTFGLLVDYDLSASGGGSGADSTSEINSSLVEVSATIPAMLAPVSGAKLLMMDKYTKSSKAKVVLVLKDTTPGSIGKGPAADPSVLSGSVVLLQVANPANRAVYSLDSGDWILNKDKVAKLRNQDAAPGAAGVKTAIVKPDKRLKIIAKNLGDGDAASGDQDANDLDLSALTPADSVMALVTIDNADDSSTRTMCALFEAPVIKSIAGGTGIKYLSKTSVPCP